MQTLNDGGNASFDNDRWALDIPVHLLSATERTPEGDLWLVPFYVWRGTWYGAPLRYHQGRWIEFEHSTPPGYTHTIDIFAQDEHHTWFAYGTFPEDRPSSLRGILALDDAGTIDDFTDDVWSDYPLETSGEGGAVAVDSLGRLWFGDSSGLYLYQQDAWQPFQLGVYQQHVICDLTPAPNGVLFVQVDVFDASCDYADFVYAIHPDGSLDYGGVGRFVQSQYEIVRSTVHRNRLWTVAPDGAIWYMADG
jgi:hypothetical protein